MVTDSKAKKPKAKKPAAKKEAVAAKAPVSGETTQASGSGGLNRRRVVVGTVVSDKMTKTIVVKVDRQVRHRLYKKYINRSRRFKAHDETNNAKIGDLVSLVESRPLSREKRWVLQSIIRRGNQAPEANV